MKTASPIDPDRYLGTMTRVSAMEVQVNFPDATARPERRGLARGAVGDFVFVDCDAVKILGRVVETRIPDAERLTVEPQLGRAAEPNPIGRVQLLAALEQGGTVLRRGIPSFPRIGDSVHLADPRLLADLIRAAVASADDTTLNIGRINAADGVDIRLPPEKLFGRHTGIFGATGGGKSWTLARLIQELKRAHGKAILFDPTGEFVAIDGVDRVFVFEPGAPEHTHVHFPYRKITEDDLFALFRPSGQSQGPKLREAIKSLKLVEATAGEQPAGVHFAGSGVRKRGEKRAPFYVALATHGAAIHAPHCAFDILKLADQIKAECVYNTDFKDDTLFGPADPTAIGHCETLVARINTQIYSSELRCLFHSDGSSLVDELDKFLSRADEDVAVISFRDIRFEHNTRELLLNMIGRYLLGLARAGQFRDQPLVVFLDEAHQFLGRSVGDEYNSTQLDAFGLIAKEGRKYGLTCVLATQRPRDIPHDVLSQLGTLFVHRLTNQHDRDTVESACGDLDRGAAQFIPMLAPGEAVVIGPDLPAPVPVFIHPPSSPPNSRGPAYRDAWRRRHEMALAACDQPTPPPDVAVEPQANSTAP